MKNLFQNDILELHVALAKKIVYMFEKSIKNFQNWGLP